MGGEDRQDPRRGGLNGSAPRKLAPAPIGVFDSGAGGLSIVAAIRAALPAQPIVYFADTAYAPYGLRSDQEILARTQQCCKHLFERGIAALVLACNTATANAIDELRAWAPVPVVGVEPGLKPAASATKKGIVGVLATQATLGSRRYRDLLRRVQEHAPGVRFLEHAAPGWVELVESGELDSPRARALVREAVQPLIEAQADTLVLGCTHFPFLQRIIREYAGAALLLETGPAVARELQRRVAPVSAAPGSSARSPADSSQLLELETSGDRVRFCALAARLLEVAASDALSHAA